MVLPQFWLRTLELGNGRLAVFGPPSRYPGAPWRQYQPVEAPLAAYAAVARALGTTRRVLVHASRIDEPIDTCAWRIRSLGWPCFAM